jgi:hemoglobin
VSERPSLYEFAGGDVAFLRLASAMHQRCIADPVLEHPFSHTSNPDHIENLASYWSEVFGGPTRYSTSLGGHSGMLAMHASTGADDDYASRFVACFDQAVDDADLPSDIEFRRVLHDYMVWATNEVTLISPMGSTVEGDLAFPGWSWDGLQS